MVMRSYVLGSLIGHLALTLVGATLTQAFRQPPPSMNLIRVGLMEIEPVVVPPREAPVVRESPAPPPEEAVAAPETEPPPKAIPKPPPELQRPARPVVPERIADDPEPEPVALHPPDPQLPPAPELASETVAPPDVDFPEPEPVQRTARPEEPPAVVEAEQVAPGAQVQATAPAGVDDSYLRLVQQKIGRRWQPTPASASGRAGVRVALRFRILGNGAIADVMVVSSSGLSVFDRQARSAIASANPLPRPPSRFGGEGIEITFHFVYNP